MYRKDDGLKSKIPPGREPLKMKRGYYRGEAQQISAWDACGIPLVRHFKKRVKAHHETFNGHLKSFNILDEGF
jgi:hypothetical protein